MTFIHIINRDRFTDGYIKYIASQFPQYEHEFYTFAGNHSVEFSDNVHEISSIKSFYNDNRLKIDQSVAVIYSGVWRKDMIALLLCKRLINKTYFHFWGGDFYCYRGKTKNPLAIAKKRIAYLAFKKAKGLVFLIPGEYENFNKITNVENNSFVAPMCGDPSRKLDYLHYRKKPIVSSPFISIIVGNSATESNNHEEVFKKLQHLELNKIRIYCPLSYGDDDYRNRIMKIGKDLLGDSFYPITESLSYDNYVDFLSDMDVGIFNNNRQQAMGNISTLIGIGKKVYLRKETSMWTYFNKLGYNVFPVDDLETTSLSELIRFNRDKRDKNLLIFDELHSAEYARNAWKTIFDDAIGNKKS